MQPDICVRTFPLPYAEREFYYSASTSLWMDTFAPGVNFQGKIVLFICAEHS